MEAFLTYSLFVLGFIVLIKGADLLVGGGASIAKKYKISNLVIGLTIVAFGSSAPELVVNLLASTQDSSALAIGNILGSNIANIFLILGISACIYPLVVHKNTIWKEIPLSLLAVVVLGVMANDVFIDQGTVSILSRIDGIIMLSFFIIFIYYTFGIAKIENHVETDDIKSYTTGKSLLFIALGLLGLGFGGHWIVQGAVDIATRFGMSESVIGLTIVAVGTSLPELATSAVAAYRKNTDIAIGNVVGSNIFNVFWILGLSATIKPLPFTTANNIDIGMVILASFLLFAFLFIGKKHHLERWQGIIFLLIYVVYTIYLVGYSGIV